MDDEKPLYWVSSALDDLRVLPAEVKEVFGFALHLAQWGDRHPGSKPLKGFKGASVLEVVEDFDGDLVKQRLKLAEAWYHKLTNDDD